MTQPHPTLLPRERTALADDVRSVPAPRLPAFEPPWTLRPVDPASADPDLIADWMARPHLIATWDQPWSADRWRSDSAARLAGSYSRPGILEYLAAPAAYIELYRFPKDECGALCAADPWDVGFHIATGDSALTGRGIMSAWIAALGSALWAAEPRCRRLFGDPDHRNAPIRRALAKSGFHDLGEFDIRPDRRIALHCLPRRPRDLPQLTGASR